ncbi:hypothetical protein BELL_1156g00020 [Botrytis elliptica]|uniref:Uncharacterized protein n=1 Tax=Botrytis elliptica TaxID=278938 RepID=A0A4Z1IIX2_9HELO|nr:hypothetical protein BELL_1156g00020 [Botrytis elliptica]
MTGTQDGSTISEDETEYEYGDNNTETGTEEEEREEEEKRKKAQITWESGERDRVKQKERKMNRVALEKAEKVAREMKKSGKKSKGKEKEIERERRDIQSEPASPRPQAYTKAFLVVLFLPVLPDLDHHSSISLQTNPITIVKPNRNASQSPHFKYA